MSWTCDLSNHRPQSIADGVTLENDTLIEGIWDQYWVRISLCFAAFTDNSIQTYRRSTVMILKTFWSNVLTTGLRAMHRDTRTACM